MTVWFAIGRPDRQAAKLELSECTRDGQGKDGDLITRPVGGRDPFRPLDVLAALWSSAVALPPLSTGAGAAYRTLMVTLRRTMVGRRLTVRLENSDITLTVTTLDARLDVRALGAGQLGGVRITARDVHWDGSQIGKLTAVLHNVSMRPGSPTVLAAGPVDLSLDVPTTAISDMFLWAMPRLAGHIDDDGIARLRFARWPRVGYVEVDVRLAGLTVLLKPRAIGIGRRRLRVPSHTPAYPVRLPDLPNNAQVTGISVEPGLLRVFCTVAQWRMEVPRTRIDAVFTQLNRRGTSL